MAGLLKDRGIVFLNNHVVKQVVGESGEEKKSDEDDQKPRKNVIEFAGEGVAVALSCCISSNFLPISISPFPTALYCRHSCVHASPARPCGVQRLRLRDQSRLCQERLADPKNG